MSERMKLTITEVGEETKIGEKQIPCLRFKARIGDGAKALPFQTWKQSLFDIIKAGELDADVETKMKQTDDGNTFVTRNVVQVYKDGNAMLQARQGQTGFRSPEERASIERQVAVKCSFELREHLGDGMDDNEKRVYEAALSWVAEQLGVLLFQEPQKTAGKAPLPTQQAGSTTKPPASDAPAQKTTIVGKTDYRELVDIWPPGMDGAKIKDGTDLAIFAGKHGINIADFRRILAVGKPQDVVKVREAAHELFPQGVHEAKQEAKS